MNLNINKSKNEREQKRISTNDGNVINDIFNAVYCAQI